jgi:sugar transferase EpsL
LKRLFDIVLASMAIVMFSPVLLFVALIIRLRLGGPVIFQQQRPGLRAVPFMVYKFRTMIEGYDSRGGLLPDSERMTQLGVFLRKYSLDELPQLFNVLKGDLSLVGPRPLLMEYLPLYTKEQSRRHEVSPGITGWAQVNGRNAVSWEEKFRYDIWYVDNQSLQLDLKILWMTVAKVLRSDGISQQGKVTMEKFKGSADRADTS